MTDNTGFQKYIVSRLFPLGEYEFEVLRSLILGCSYGDYFAKDKFTEEEYSNIVSSLHKAVNESDSAKFLEAAHKRGFILNAPSPEAKNIWPLFEDMNEERVEDGMYLWSVQEVYRMMKEELSLFESLDDTSKKEALDIRGNYSSKNSPTPLFSSILKTVDEESDDNTHLPENIEIKELQDILKVQMENYLSLQMGTIKGTNTKEAMQSVIMKELKNMN
jgi:hypothetical protein